MNEFELIAYILKRLAVDRRTDGVAVGAGDDAAVLDRSLWPVVTVDTMVEGVHWDPRISEPFDVGFKLLACNLSDIAAMGGTPGPMLLALTLRDDPEQRFLQGMLEGIDEARRAHGLSEDVVAPIGGDITRTDGPRVLSLVLFGEKGFAGRLLMRRHARIGDSVWVTGTLGSAAAGLAVLRHGLGNEPRFRDLVEKHKRPMARLDAAGSLVRMADVHGAIDLSDGLAGDLLHILEASGVGAEIRLDLLPGHPSLTQAASRVHCHPLEWMLSGGDDYELLITAAPRINAELESLGLTWIGRTTDRQGLVYIDSEGRHVDPKARGYTHW